MTISKEAYEEAHGRHIELWDWCYHHPSKAKASCPKWKDNGGEWEANDWECFACEVIDSGGSSCRACPVDWGEDCLCCSKNSPFNKWDDSQSPKTRKKYAALVRDAVWMKYEEWIKL